MINSIIHGDCFEVMQEIPDGSVDMVLCDLPYGTTNNHWDSVIPLPELWKQYERIIKDNGCIALTAHHIFTGILMMSNPKMFRYKWVWEKTNSTGFLDCKKRPMRIHEDILIYYKEQPVYDPQMSKGDAYKVKSGSQSNNYSDYKRVLTENLGLRYPLDVIKINNETSIHPTQKPVKLFEYLIKTYTNPGMLILDNCAGSGTTAIAAMNLKRNFICIEKDDEYYTLASNRIKNHRVQEQLFLT